MHSLLPGGGRRLAAVVAPALLWACVGGVGSLPGEEAAGLAAEVSLPVTVTAGQAGYAASVTAQPGAGYAWTIENGTLTLGATSDTAVFTPADAGTVTLHVTVTSGQRVVHGTGVAAVAPATVPRFTLEQALTDGAQGSTLAFSGFAMMTGNLGAQSFFPPGKVADYWGFQYLRDNDPDDMGHTTSFLTRVSSNVLFILDDAQVRLLRSLAATQVAGIREYAWRRYPLMVAFRRLLEGTGPEGNAGLDVDAVKAASRALYRLDGQLSFERAVVYAALARSLDGDQKRWLGSMVGKGYQAWPAKAEVDVRDRTAGLSGEEVVAVMTYAGDFYAWYAGSEAADVYFCPERHGTYFGSFYVKDAPAVGHAGYAIDEQLTAEVGRALLDPAAGYLTAGGAALLRALPDAQRDRLAGNPRASMVRSRTVVSQALRGLLGDQAPSLAQLDAARAEVDDWSGLYGALDGENNVEYATAFARVFANQGGTTLTAQGLSGLRALRQRVMTVTVAGQGDVDYSQRSGRFLYAAEVPDASADLAVWAGDALSDALFRVP